MDPAERDGSEMYVDRDRRGDLLVIRMLYIAAKSRADTGFQRNQRHHQRRDQRQNISRPAREAARVRGEFRCVRQLEYRIDERGDGTALGEENQSPKQSENNKDRHQPKLLTDLEEGQQFTQYREDYHRRCSFARIGYAWSPPRRSKKAYRMTEYKKNRKNARTRGFGRLDEKNRPPPSPLYLTGPSGWFLPVYSACGRG